jgi:hypothetical protein
LKNLIYSKLILVLIMYILFSPFFRQVIDLRSPLIRPWYMFNFIALGSIRVEVFIENKWIDPKKLGCSNFIFNNKSKALDCINKIKISNPNLKYNFVLKTSTSEGLKIEKIN